MAEEVARHLVRANLSGHDSHGVIRLPQYVGRIESGEIVASAVPRVIREVQGAALIDGAFGFGQVSVKFAVDWAERRASEIGIAAAVVRHCTHTGRLGEYVEWVAQKGRLGILTVGAAGPGVGGMVLPGSNHRFLGANPWVFGIPAAGGTAVIVDMSSSMIAQGKVAVALQQGVLLPPDTLVDRAGRPSRDPSDFQAGGGLMPLGGTVAGHKGYGLALASALIGGLAMIDDPTPSLIGAPVDPAHRGESGQIGGVFIAVIDPAVFGPREAYETLIAATVEKIKDLRGTDGAEILVPGEPEARTRTTRAEGVLLPKSLCDDLKRLSDKYRVSMAGVWEA
jgi:LDH2 family malate/lactate/ureidoglycolate dehydrogenase